MEVELTTWGSLISTDSWQPSLPAEVFLQPGFGEGDQLLLEIAGDLAEENLALAHNCARLQVALTGGGGSEGSEMERALEFDRRARKVVEEWVDEPDPMAQTGRVRLKVSCARRVQVDEVQRLLPEFNWLHPGEVTRLTQEHGPQMRAEVEVAMAILAGTGTPGGWAVEHAPTARPRMRQVVDSVPTGCYIREIEALPGTASISVGHQEAYDYDASMQQFSLIGGLDAWTSRLAVVSRWLIYSMTEDDPLKAFLFAFFGLEILVKEVYKECTSSEAWPGIEAAALAIRPHRVGERRGLKFKFVVLLVATDTIGTDLADLSLFERLTDVRNDISHGDEGPLEDIQSSASQAQNLLRRTIAVVARSRGRHE